LSTPPGGTVPPGRASTAPSCRQKFRVGSLPHPQTGQMMSPGRIGGMPLACAVGAGVGWGTGVPG